MTRKNINILIACEESQAETLAFRTLGFNAWSCDIQPCKKGTPVAWHIIGDVTPFLRGETKFVTQDGNKHSVRRWHFILAHPPCTYICKLSIVQLYKNNVLDESRLEKMKEAVRFFQMCLDAKADFVAVENPLPMKRASLPKPTCYACPSWFGAKYTKKTLYWTKNLPPLMPKCIFPKAKSYVNCSKGKYRSRTLPQLAQAIAEQWGEYIYRELKVKQVKKRKR